MERLIINGTWSRPRSGRGKLSCKRPLWSYLPRPEWYGKKHGVSDSEASEADQEQESEDDEEEEGEENQPRDIAASFVVLLDGSWQGPVLRRMI